MEQNPSSDNIVTMKNLATNLNNTGVQLLASRHYVKAEEAFRTALLSLAMDCDLCSSNPCQCDDQDQDCLETVDLEKLDCPHFSICNQALRCPTHLSAALLSSVIQFNMALCMHQQGHTSNKLHQLQDALYFYQQAADTTLAFDNGNTSSHRSMMALLVMAALNNQSQILYCCDWFRCSHLSVAQLEYNRGMTFALLHRMCGSHPERVVAPVQLELINNVVLNWTVVTVLKLPSNAACA